MPFNGSWLIRWEVDHLPLNTAKLFSLGFFSSGNFFNRDCVLNELHVSHRSIVAIAEAHLQDTSVAALTIVNILLLLLVLLLAKRGPT